MAYPSSSDGFDALDEINSVEDLSEDDVSAIQPGGFDGGDEKLGSIGVGSGIGHAQVHGPFVLQIEIFVLEFASVDALSSATVVHSEITTLDHEVGNDAVESASLVVQRLSALSDALFTGAEGTEVLGSFGGFAEETKDDASLLATGDFDVEEDLCLDGLAGGDGQHSKEKGGGEIHGEKGEREKVRVGVIGVWRNGVVKINDPGGYFLGVSLKRPKTMRPFSPPVISTSKKTFVWTVWLKRSGKKSRSSCR
eukprot:CAMPEP_0201215244 /NCGR_PEP_ID=MMETSP0851-20130426/188858_1 /ASSEMBLY_ACC=CAM_ASM_000631 /TAXON_ID=183588 /ORGANISM="Pseudo-nitzschia fraudulenta, Strain WWA7" /LENGTH=251 /DNA_ID=CAMNT_0047504689 /DNA_START=202 /DNA_END=958 /DNA_ORIENTATION=-